MLQSFFCFLIFKHFTFFSSWTRRISTDFFVKEILIFSVKVPIYRVFKLSFCTFAANKKNILL